jgi:hypothetical protein
MTLRVELGLERGCHFQRTDKRQYRTGAEETGLSFASHYSMYWQLLDSFVSYSAVYKSFLLSTSTVPFVLERTDQFSLLTCFAL